MITTFQKLFRTAWIGLALLALALSILTIAFRTAHADISNPNSLPPNNSITSSMLKSGIITDTNVSGTASISATKITAGSGTGAVLYDNGSSVGTSTAFEYSTSTQRITAGGYSATNGQFCNGSTCFIFPVADGNAGQQLVTNGSKTLSFASTTLDTNQQIFTSSGTFTVPTGVNYVYVTVQAGGGSPSYNTGSGVGSGAGAGGYAFGLLNVSATTSIQVIVGSGATAPSSSGNGTQGGTSSFGNFISCTGGSGGVADYTNAVAGGSGGSCTGGDVDVTGQSGSFSSITGAIPGQGGVTVYGYSYGAGANGTQSQTTGNNGRPGIVTVHW